MSVRESRFETDGTVDGLLRSCLHGGEGVVGVCTTPLVAILITLFSAILPKAHIFEDVWCSSDFATRPVSVK